MSKPTDTNSLPEFPFIYDRRIRWGDTDVAKIAYTGVFPQIGLEALEEFSRVIFGEGWYENTLQQGRGNPFVHLSFDFHASITPSDTLHVAVWIEKIGRTSLSYLLEGHILPSGEKSFTARFTHVYVDITNRKPIRIPDHLRAKAEEYQTACKAFPGPDEFSLAT